ncbi:MAG TPA: dienelactone hydrolase family protein [Candidatus Binatia bacterium]|jgi:carboxymethylenebutenolidase
MLTNVEELIQKYRDGGISRREFIQQAVVLTGSLAVATSLIDSLLSLAAHAAQVDPNDPALTSSDVKFAAEDGAAIGGYLTRPKGDGKFPAVIVIHGNSGIDDHIHDVARRIAKAGYVALTPDLLSRQGGTASFPSSAAATEGTRKVNDDTIVRDLNGAINFLKAQNFVRPKIGVVGFCWGGSRALMFTTRSKDLAASVIYYGSNPSNLDDVKNIIAPVLGQYGGADERVTSGAPKLDEAMKKYGKSFEYKIYAGAPHSFNNDTSPRSYREEAAKEAWARTLEFFKKHLES